MYYMSAWIYRSHLSITSYRIASYVVFARLLRWQWACDISTRHFPGHLSFNYRVANTLLNLENSRWLSIIWLFYYYYSFQCMNGRSRMSIWSIYKSRMYYVYAHWDVLSNLWDHVMCYSLSNNLRYRLKIGCVHKRLLKDIIKSS